MSEAIMNWDEVRAVGAADLAELKRRARASERRRCRICLHHSHADAIQEMVICLAGFTYFRPHRHPAGRSESYHLIEGRLRVFFFDEAGVVTDAVTLAAPGEALPGDHGVMYRLSAPLFHFVLPLSGTVIYHETLTGPWDREGVVEEADFAPDEADAAAVAAFVKRVVQFDGAAEAAS